MEFKLVHTFEAEINSFVDAVYFDEELNKRLLKMPNVSNRVVKDLKRDGDKASRTMFIEVASAIPKEVRALIGDKLGWNEESTLDKKTNTVAFKILPTVKLPLECSGTYVMTADGPNKVKRVISGDVKVKIPFLGKTVEKLIVSQLIDSFEKEEIIVKEYLKDLAKR